MSQRIDPTILSEITDARDVTLSPDGKLIVYTCRPFWVRSGKDITNSIWIAEVGKENSAREIAAARHHHGAVQFSPSGRYVSFTWDRGEAGKRGKSVIYLLGLQKGGDDGEDGHAFALTDASGKEVTAGNFKWRPDGKAIAFTSVGERPDEKPDESEKERENVSDANVRGKPVGCARLRVLDLETKEVKDLTDGECHVADFEWNFEGTEIVYGTYEGASITDWEVVGATLHVVNVSDTRSRELHKVGYFVSGLSWVDDRVFWITSTVSGSDPSSRTIFSINAQNPEKEPQAVAYGQTDCAYSLRRCSGKLVASVFQGLADVIETLDGTEIYNQKHQTISYDVKFGSVGEAPIVALSYGTTSKPIEVFSIVDGKKVQLSQHSKHISQHNIGRAHLIEHTHEDGTPITGFYAVPTAHENSFQDHKPRPTVVMVHGGPYARVTDSFDHFANWHLFFLSLGYLVLTPNYRGGCGHGHDYANAVHHDIAAGYKDILWLVKKGISDGYIDKDRVAITGWSMGGYYSYLAATRDQDFHFQAVVAGAGVTDWSAMASTTDIPVWASSMSGASPWAVDNIDDVQARKNSPIFYVKNVKSPILIIHGDLDARIPIEQAVGFYRGMKYHGLDVEFVSYPTEGHGWPVPFEKANYLDMMGRIETFLVKHLGEA